MRTSNRPEDIGPTILADGTKDWSRYNATIPGNLPLPSAPRHPRHAPGLEATQGPRANPPPYKPVSFAAQCEWPDDEIGWQRVVRKKKTKRSPKKAEE